MSRDLGNERPYSVTPSQVGIFETSKAMGRVFCSVCVSISYQTAQCSVDAVRLVAPHVFSFTTDDGSRHGGHHSAEIYDLDDPHIHDSAAGIRDNRRPGSISQTGRMHRHVGVDGNHPRQASVVAFSKSRSRLAGWPLAVLLGNLLLRRGLRRIGSSPPPDFLVDKRVPAPSPPIPPASTKHAIPCPLRTLSFQETVSVVPRRVFPSLTPGIRSERDGNTTMQSGFPSGLGFVHYLCLISILLLFHHPETNRSP